MQRARSHGPCVLVCLAAMLGFVSCKSPKTHVAQELVVQTEEFRSEIQRQSDLPTRSLNWDEALRFMIENNPELLHSILDHQNSLDRERQIYKDLIPSLNLRASATKELTQLHMMSLDDVSFNANTFFNLPGLTSFYGRLYAAKLAAIRSEIQLRLNLREKTSELFMLFHEAGSLRDKRETLSAEERRIDSSPRQDDPQATAYLDNAHKALETESRQLQERISGQLGNYEHEWVLSTEGTPDLLYTDSPAEFREASSFARLQLKYSAVELTSARAQLLGLKLRRYPDFNMFVTSPPLFTRAYA